MPTCRHEAVRPACEVYKGPDKILHCPGFGICGTCRVLITKGIENASPKGWREWFKLKYASLACDRTRERYAAVLPD